MGDFEMDSMTQRDPRFTVDGAPLVFIVALKSDPPHWLPGEATPHFTASCAVVEPEEARGLAQLLIEQGHQQVLHFNQVVPVARLEEALDPATPEGVDLVPGYLGSWLDPEWVATRRHLTSFLGLDGPETHDERARDQAFLTAAADMARVTGGDS